MYDIYNFISRSLVFFNFVCKPAPVNPAPHLPSLCVGITTGVWTSCQSQVIILLELLYCAEIRDTLLNPFFFISPLGVKTMCLKTHPDVPLQTNSCCLELDLAFMFFPSVKECPVQCILFFIYPEY